MRCPKLFHYRYIEKRKEPEVMHDTRIGKSVHTALEHALRGMPVDMAIDKGAASLANSDEDDRYRRICRNIAPYLARVDAFRRSHRVRRQFVEFRLGMDEHGEASAFAAKNTYFRGIIDVAYTYGAGTYALVDHKSGMRQPNTNIVEQLEGYAALASVAFREVQRVLLGVHWVASAQVDWSPMLSLQSITEELMPKTLANIEAAALAVADGPRPQESPWCLRCSYRSVCPQADIARFEPTDPYVEVGVE